jgi:hypothetical protein
MPHLRRFVSLLSHQKCQELAGIKISPVCITIPQSKKSDIHFEEVRRFGAAHDRFWKLLRKKYPLTTDRTAQYLNWRYVNHPLFTYRIFAGVDGKKISSYIIIRIEKVPGYTIARVVDFVAHDKAEEATLRFAAAFAARQSAALIDFFFTGNFHAAALKKAGFIETIAKPYSEIPMLFNPIDRKKASINFAFLPVSKKLDLKKMQNINSWYMTKGDSDQDRPN